MDRQSILIVTHGFFPEQSPRAFRATELAKEFCRQGHQVTVVAPFREGMDSLFNEYPIIFKSLGKFKWRIFNLKNFGGGGKLYNRLVNRFLPLLFEYPGMELVYKVNKVLKNISVKYDMLISVAVPYPIHWGVATLWQTTKTNIAKIWVADCGDPYCLQENDSFQPPFYFRWIEKWFMRKVDYVSVPTEKSFTGYFPEFHTKLKVIPQGFRFEDVKQLDVKHDEVIRFGYGGVFIQGKRDPSAFLEYLTCLGSEVRFEFHVFTSQEHFVERYGLRDCRIKWHAPVSRLELLKNLSSYHFVVNFANMGMAQTPSKLIDYVIINKPILNIVSGDLNENLIRSFFKGDYTDKMHIDNVDRYRIEHVANKFLALVP